MPRNWRSLAEASDGIYTVDDFKQEVEKWGKIVRENSAADCMGWMKEAGFRETRVEHLVVDPAAVRGLQQRVVEEEAEPAAGRQHAGDLGDCDVDVSGLDRRFREHQRPLGKRRTPAARGGWGTATATPNAARPFLDPPPPSCSD